MAWQARLDYEFGPYRLDTRDQRLTREGGVVPLTPTVFDLLLALVKNAGHVLTKDEIIKLVWNDAIIEEGNIARNISTLRKALGEKPRESQYIETIPWRGYRFIAEVKQVRDLSLDREIDSIAVLPFVNDSDDADADYLTDGLTENLINNLSQLTRLRVMSRNSVFRYKGKEIDARTVGNELKVQTVLVGRVSHRSDLLSVSVELIDARDNSHIWGEQYNRKIKDIFAMHETISREIAEQLHLRLTGKEEQRIRRRHTKDSEAYLLYLRGRYYFNKLSMDGVERGAAHFQQAIDRDPKYALAYAGLADCFNYMAKREEAKQAAIQALALDNTLGEVHATLGFFKFLYDWDFAGAEEEFRLAVELNPSYAEAHHWYAVFLANMGRHGLAAIEAKRARELDPLSLLMNMTPVLTCYLAREYDNAVAEAQKVLDLEPNFPAAHSVLGAVYEQKGMFDEALAEYQKVIDILGSASGPQSVLKAFMARVHATTGKKAEAVTMLDSVSDFANAMPYTISQVHLALGETDQAFEWLNKACKIRELQLVSLKADPAFDALRTDTRYEDILRRVGLSTN
jgi:TolB-like protein/thioredoxin-like negative regulator of GroEL